MSEFKTIDLDTFMAEGTSDEQAPVTRIGTTANTTDAGNAERFAELHGSTFRYACDMDRWFRWTGSRWKLVTGKGALRRAAKQVARQIYLEAAALADEDRRAAIARHALKSENLRPLDAMISLAQGSKVFEIIASDLDTHPLLLSAPNGTIDLRLGKLRDPAQSDLLTRGTHIPFDPEATAPRWELFLAEIFDNRDDLVEFMRRAIGYSLSGAVDGQCFFLLHGSGCNGKSLLLNVLLALLGDAGMTSPFDTFTKKYGDTGIPNDVAAMRGARIVIASEGEEGAKLAESRVKQLTGGDQVSARFMRGEYFTFHPILKLWLATNHKPNVQGTEEAIWRRMQLVPFDINFGTRADPQLQSKLMAELPGILAWAVRGCQAWLGDGGGKAGLNVSETVRNATEAYRKDSDVLGQFMTEVLVIDEHAKVTPEALYVAYKEWCEASGRRAMDSGRLGKQMKQRGYGSKSSNGSRWYSGIGLQHS